MRHLRFAVMIKVISVIGLIALVLAACGNDSDERPSAVPTPTDTTVEQPTLSPALIGLQRTYETLTASYRDISAIWEGLALNQPVTCGSYPQVTAPDSISAGDDAAYQPLADVLRRAAISLDHAVSLWKAECSQTRPTPPPDVIDEGRRAARAVGDALAEAEPLLETIQ